MAVTGASAAHAVHVNPDGLGQVLLYPYYTVQNGFVTAVHVVNTTDQAKAVKVRFLEGKNSREVLDFNLYLSPFDVWTGTVVPDAANGARLISTDKSCTAPAIPAAGVGFRNFDFASDPLSSDPNRRAEGYIELIEMGVLTDSAQITAVTHVAGVPANCAAIRSADASSPTGVAVSAPPGGLFGSGHLVSVEGGVRTSYDPVALDDFSAIPRWTRSGDVSPSLESVFPPQATILDGNQVIPFSPAGGRPAIDAVSAVLTHDTISNEYTVDEGRESQTDWIITFPTKRFYVNVPTDPQAAPFQRRWNPGTSTTPVLQACHDVGFEFFDREEASRTPDEGDFSPPPPTLTFGLCNEVNTLTIHRIGADPAEAKLFGAVSTSNTLAVEDFEAGWMQVTFAVDTATGAYGVLPNGEGAGDGEVVGLPVIGFSASRNVNKVDVQIDGLNVYSAVMGSNIHKGSKDIVPPSTAPL
jgi:hypothetical protein